MNVIIILFQIRINENVVCNHPSLRLLDPILSHKNQPLIAHKEKGNQREVFLEYNYKLKRWQNTGHKSPAVYYMCNVEREKE